MNSLTMKTLVKSVDPVHFVQDCMDLMVEEIHDKEGYVVNEIVGVIIRDCLDLLVVQNDFFEASVISVDDIVIYLEGIDQLYREDSQIELIELVDAFFSEFMQIAAKLRLVR